MFWWDWTGRQRLAIFFVMLGIAAAPWVLLGWFPGELRAFLGGTAFLMIPQLMGWMLLIGFKSKVMPMRGGKASLDDDPVTFWFVASCYSGLLVFSLWIILMISIDIIKEGLG